MKSIWRKHLIICLFFGLLSIPIYYFDQAYFRPRGGDWITLDLRGLIFHLYITVIAVELVLSSIGVLSFPQLGALRIHLSSMVLSVALFAAGGVVYGKLHYQAIANQHRKLMDSRRRLIGVIELKEWWFVPDEIHPTEIRVSVVVHQSGRFAGNVEGAQIDPSGSSRPVFESTNEPESQRWVKSGEAFTYAFPLNVLYPARADDVRIALYLFKGISGAAPGDIEKIFMKSPRQDDDGQFFYGMLPTASRPGK